MSFFKNGFTLSKIANDTTRRHPAVFASPDVARQCFVAIVLALEAEALQGANAQRVAAAGKQLLQTAGIDVRQALGILAPETQRAVAKYFT